VDGHAFPVRLNLEKVLRRIRHESESQVLWIDSICINQKDIHEKPHQVRIMGRIYKSTEECIMWLGDVEDEPIQPFKPLPRESWSPTEVAVLNGLIQDLKLTTPEPLQSTNEETASIDVPGAFEVAKLLARNIHFYEMPFFRILPTGDFELCPVWAKAVYSLENIIRRTWWTRIWTAQEAFLPERGTIHVGPYTLPYSTLLDAGSAWAYHVRSWSRNRWDNCCESIIGIWMGYSSPLILGQLFSATEDLKVLRDARVNLEKVSVAHDLFLLTITRAATIQHDHVYGLMGLIAEFFHFDEIPNYSLDLHRLYTAVTLKFMERARHLCLLSYARPHHHEQYATDKQRTIQSELPSWCPDWNPAVWKEDDDYFDIYNYGGFTADNLQTYDGERQGDTILKLQGVLAGKISKMGGTPPKLMKVPPAEYVPAIQTWLDLAESKGLSPKVIWELVHVATHKDVGLAVVDQQAAWWEILKELARDNATSAETWHVAEQKDFKHHQQSMDALKKRSTFAIDPVASDSARGQDSGALSEYQSKLPQGSVGFSRPGPREGDYIFVVKGGRTPLIFRPIDGESLRLKALESGISEQELANCFTFVGTTYVYGMMQGQVVGENSNYEQVYLL
jgi:hypothetical protein